MQTTLNRLLQRRAIRSFDPVAPEGHVVFNFEQVDGLTQHYYARPKIRCLRPSASKTPSIF